MLNNRFEKRIIQKKYILFFLLLGFAVSVFLCLANQVSMVTKPASELRSSAPLLIQKGNQHTLFSLESSNIFQISFPSRELIPLVTNPDADEQITEKIVISDIVIQSVFGGTISFHGLNIATRSVDFIKASPFLDININDSFLRNHLSTPLMIGYFFAVGLLFAVGVILGLFIFDNLLKSLCLVVVKIIDVIERHPRVVMAVSTLALLVVLALSIWVCFCGLLFQDEGFFNLMAQYPEDVRTGLPSTYYQITHLIFLASWNNLVVFRSYTVIGSIISIFVLNLVIVKYMRLKLKLVFPREITYLLFILLFIVNCFQFAHHITPDYNNLSRIIVYGQVSILILVLYNLVSKNIGVFVLGLISGVNFFIKFPEAVASILLISLIFIGIYRKEFWIKLLSLYGGVVVSMLVYFEFVQSVTNYWSVLSSSFYYTKLVGGHPVGVLLSKNFNDIVSLVVPVVIYLVLYQFLTTPLRGRVKTPVIPITIISLILLCSILSMVTVGRYYQLAFMYAQVSELFLIVLAIIVYENIRGYMLWDATQKRQYKQVSWLCVLLLIFTYLASLGTDTSILYHVMFHPTLIFAVIILQWWTFDKSNAGRYFLILILILSTTVIFIQAVIYNNILFVNLFNQNTSYQVGKSRVFLSKSSVSSLRDLKHQLISCGYHDGDYIAGYYAMPDIVYALGGRSPVTPWFSPSTKGTAQTQRANQYLFSLMSEDIKKHLFVMVDSERLDSGLTTLGFDDPQKLIYCGAVNVGDDNYEFSIKKFTLFHYDDNVLHQ